MTFRKLAPFLALWVSCDTALADGPPLNGEQALDVAIGQYLYLKLGVVPETPQSVTFSGGLDGVAKAGEPVWEIKFDTPNWTEDILYINPRTKNSCVLHWGEHWKTTRHSIEQCAPITNEGFSTK